MILLLRLLKNRKNDSVLMRFVYVAYGPEKTKSAQTLKNIINIIMFVFLYKTLFPTYFYLLPLQKKKKKTINVFLFEQSKIVNSNTVPSPKFYK